MTERIIVSLTTWSKRIGNIPVVLDTIFNQTMQPDLVVLNLAHGEIIPKEIQQYIDSHNIEINRVPDTKVYKKLIPTLKKYPNDCVISIDDDWLYPQKMIADFMAIHKQYPFNPISGNREVMFNMQCHCGCASLIKAEYLGKYLDYIDEDIVNNCSSDDIVYTFFANKSGHPYIRTKELYFTNLTPYNDCNSYSDTVVFSSSNGINNSYNYLAKKYGDLLDSITLYVKDEMFSNIISDILKKRLYIESQKSMKNGKEEVYNTISFKLGYTLLKPIRFLKKIFNN